MKKWIVGIALLSVCIAAYAQYSVGNYHEQGGAWVLGGEVKVSPTATALTSPTVTFSAANLSFVTLTTDANLTGVYPTGGRVGQVLTVKSGAGSNTMRLDDSASSMTIGANVTLTEGQNDFITLYCTSADGDEWAALAAHDN